MEPTKEKEKLTQGPFKGDMPFHVVNTNSSLTSLFFFFYCSEDGSILFKKDLFHLTEAR